MEGQALVLNKKRESVGLSEAESIQLLGAASSMSGFTGGPYQVARFHSVVTGKFLFHWRKKALNISGLPLVLSLNQSQLNAPPV